MICPRDGQVCMDDMCYGGAPVCGADYNEECLVVCDGCGATYRAGYLGAFSNLCPACDDDLDEDEWV